MGRGVGWGRGSYLPSMRNANPTKLYDGGGGIGYTVVVQILVKNDCEG